MPEKSSDGKYISLHTSILTVGCKILGVKKNFKIICCVLKWSSYPQLWAGDLQILQIWRKKSLQRKKYDFSFQILQLHFFPNFIETEKSGFIYFKIP